MRVDNILRTLSQYYYLVANPSLAPDVIELQNAKHRTNVWCETAETLKLVLILINLGCVV